MGTSIKIVVISVGMYEEDAINFYQNLEDILKHAFIKKSFIKVEVYTNIKNVKNLKKNIILFTDENTVDVILVFNKPSLKNIIIEEINKVSNAKTDIVKLLAKIPILLWPSMALTSDNEFLYYSYRGNTLIFCMTGDEMTILNNLETIIQSIMLAAYLLQNIINCDVSNYSLEKGDQIMLCDNNDQSSPPKREEKKMSISPTLTCDKKIQIDEANAFAPTYQEEKTLSMSPTLTCDEKLQIDEANAFAPTYQEEKTLSMSPTLTSLQNSLRKMMNSFSVNILTFYQDFIKFSANFFHQGCDEKLQIDEANAFAPTYQEEKTLSMSPTLTCDENIQINEANIHASTNQTIHLPMVAVEVALSMIYDELMKNNDSLRKAEYVDIKNSFGKRICDAVVCRTNVPIFSVATKHGYAVSEKEMTKAKEIEEISVKSNKIISLILDPNTTKWVNSGDLIPLEATAVIPTDNVKIFYDYKGDEVKATLQPIKHGQNIKFVGSDIREGEIIIHHNVSIGSMEMGLLAACGWKKINVFREIGIGVLTIGDKLLEPGESLEPKHSYDSNRAILVSLLKENGFNSSDFGITAKIPTIIIQKIKEALETVDLLITTGYSNDKDCLKAILKNNFNATLHFGNVNMKPGKSTVFATCIFNDKTKYILCLPGNPVSVFVSAHIFLLTLLNLMHNNIELKPTIVMAKIKQKLYLHLRPRYVLATLFWPDGERYAEVICKESNSINNNLSNIINANALLILPMKTPEIDTLEAPSFVQAMLIKFPSTYMPTNKIVQLI